jgi:exopolysaccharide production protein ExoQ
MVLLVLVGANGSATRAKSICLDARWGALFALALVLAPYLRRLERRDLRIVALLATIPAVGLVSILWSVDPRLTFERVVSFSVVILIAVGIALWRRTSAATGPALVRAIAFTNLAVVAASLAEGAVWPGARENGELRGVFENPNGLGLFLGLTAPSVVAWLEYRGWQRAIVPFLAGTGGIALLSHSRSGLVALIASMAVFEIGRRRFRRLALEAVVVAVALVVALLVVKPLVHHAPAATHTGVVSTAAPGARAVGGAQGWLDRATGARTEAWRATDGFIRSRPVLGWGFGTGDRIFGRYPYRVHFVYFEGDNPNNGYLQLVLELGILGAALALLPLAAGVAAGVRALRRGPVDPVTAAMVATLAAGLLAAVVESLFESAGAPWALLIWTATAAAVLQTPHQVPERTARARRRLSSARIATAAALVVVALTGAAILVHRHNRDANRVSARELLTAEQTLNRSCGRGCSITELTRLKGTYWWIAVSGSRKRCYVVDVARFPADPREAFKASCAPLVLVNNHILTVGIRNPGPPYYTPPTASPGGFEPAVVEELARRLGVPFLEWKEVQAGVPRDVDFVVHAKSRRADASPLFFPYVGLREGLLTRSGTAAASAQTLADVRRLSLGAADTTAAAFLRDRLHVPVAQARSVEAALLKLRSGRLDGLVVEPSTGTQVAASSGNRLTLSALFAPYLYYGIELRQTSPLLRPLRRQFEAMRRDGTLLRLRKDILGLYPPVHVIAEGASP